MQSELSALRKEIAEMSTNSVTAEDTMAEVEDRILRSRNVIIYNVPELLDPSIREKIETDTIKVNDLLVNSGVDYKIEKVICIGKNSVNPTRPRRLKVVLSDSSSAKQLLKRKSRIANEYKIVNDFTLRQREYLKNLRLKLDNWIKNGESDVTIKYIKGIPNIIKVSKNST